MFVTRRRFRSEVDHGTRGEASWAGAGGVRRMRLSRSKTLSWIGAATGAVGSVGRAWSGPGVVPASFGAGWFKDGFIGAASRETGLLGSLAGAVSLAMG